MTKNRGVLISAVAALAAFAAVPGLWEAGPVLFGPGPAGSFDETAVKDPSVVFSGGLWHVFYTARGRKEYSLGYVSAPSLEKLNGAPRYNLSLRGRKENYAAAPQVFFFRPHKKWYLIYQTTDSNYQPVYSTSNDLAKPDSWTPPKDLVLKQDKAKWIDFWVICDEVNAYLFFTRAHRDVMVMTTLLAEFPKGFRYPQPVISPLIEAAHVYRVKGAGAPRFVMIYEMANGSLRRFALAESQRPAGPWKVTDPNFAEGAQLRFPAGVDKWTSEVSHGELLRSGVDERMEIEPGTYRFLVQGMPEALHAGDYPSLPWRLGLIQK